MAGHKRKDIVGRDILGKLAIQLSDFVSFSVCSIHFEWSRAHLSEAKMSEAKRVIAKQA